jgi:hypothetical protein
MSSLKVLAVGAVIAAVGAISGVAVAAQPKSLRVGELSFPATPTSNPLITFNVVRIGGGHAVSKGGREVVAWVKLTCTSSPTPPAGIAANQPILLRIPGDLTIAGHRRFGYTGPATVYPIGADPATAKTDVVLKARFVGRATTRTAAYPTGFQGSFASSACAPSSLITFSFPYL